MLDKFANPVTAVVTVVVAFVMSTVTTLSYVVKLIYDGKLIPKTLHDQAIKDRDERVERAEKIADEYKSAYDKQLETINTMSTLLQTISTTTQTTHALLEGIRQAAARAASESQGGSRAA